jgi:hypothetical protein
VDGGIPCAKESPEVKQGHLTPRPRPEVVVDMNAVKDLSYAAMNAPSASPVAGP